MGTDLVINKKYDPRFSELAQKHHLGLEHFTPGGDDFDFDFTPYENALKAMAEAYELGRKDK